MDKLKKTRKATRATITRTITQVEAELAKAAPDVPEGPNGDELVVQLECLRELEEKLSEVNEKIWDAIVDTKNDAECETEMEATTEETRRIGRCKLKINKFLESLRPPTTEACDNSSAVLGRKNYKLPKVEIKKFSGEVTEWLSWWHQFERIHVDDELHNADKFQYLAQSMVVKSKAEEVIRVYPQTAANYPKAIQALQDRFGKSKILKRVYVRELLKMIIKNSRERIKISSIYDKLDGHLKALESLGITQDQIDVLLFPMVESLLPDDIIVAWQRSSNYGREDKTLVPPKTEFDYLMEFIQMEVEHENQRELASSGFGLQKDKVKEGVQNRMKREEIPTAASLSSTSNVKECVFCGKPNHRSELCFKAKKMSYDEKQQLVKSKNCCFKCLKTGHQSRRCSSNIKCPTCAGPHHELLCSATEKKEPSIDNSGSMESADTGRVTASNSNHHQIQEVLMKTVHVRVKGTKGTELVVRLLFDEGSQRSYVKTRVAEDVGCRAMDTISLRNNLFGGHQTQEKVHVNYEVNLQGIHNNVKKKLKLTSEDIICSSCPTVPRGPWMEELAKENIVITDTWADTPEIQILIGSDLWGLLMTGKMKKLKCGLIAVESVFGWTLSGSIPIRDSVACSVITMLTQGERSLQDMWSLEVLGIRDKAEQISQEEHDFEVKKRLQDNISRGSDGRYCVRLPWVDESMELPDNRIVAEKRLHRATEKLIQQGEFQTYDRIFKDWEDEGIIEVCEVHVESGAEHFLPHRPVFKPASLTTPVRPVFDGSFRVGKNPSLNHCLEKGPNMLELIASILLRFRQRKIGVTADIRKAFQMIDVASDDRNYQKFLWWEDESHHQLKTYRHCRVVFGMNCSPFILAAVLDFHLSHVQDEYKEVAEIVRKSLYVDNIGTSVDSEDQLEEFKKKSIAIFNDAKMELRQWGTSVDDPLDSNSINMLGLLWKKDEDTMCVPVPEDVVCPEIVNKRAVLSLVSRIFDPLGFVCPVLLQPKIMLQNSWAVSMDWDTEWGEQEAEKFKNWLADLPRLNEIKILRWSHTESSRGLQLHLFTDASKDAYAGVVFARTVVEGQVTVLLLLAKSRLAPLDKKKSKRVTIPRLELMGCLIGSRLLQNVKDSLELHDARVFCWSDSMTCLSWIKRNENWGTFVGNRVREVNRLTNCHDWRFVPGVLNPADLPSRGCSPLELQESRWWEGPDWLRETEDHWPINVEVINEEEVAAEKMKTVVSAVAATSSRGFAFSSFLKNVRVAAWIRRFVSNIRRAKRERNLCLFLSLEELRLGEVDIIRSIQHDHCSILPKMKGLQLEKQADGLFHVKTRLGRRAGTELFCSPILLPKEESFTQQLIEYVHRSHCHAGVQFVLGYIRRKYWIPQGRKTVARVLHRCVVCRRHDAKCVPCDPATLPQNRLEAKYSFQTTGVDLAGPLIMKGGKKSWIVIYTCAVYRGVVFDVVDTISTDEFLESLDKFTLTTGRPNTIYSDNGTNFVGSANFLKKVKMDKLHVKGINWIFNPPTAAWWGGWWERLVRSLKDMLKRMIGTAKLTRRELEKCLVSIAYTMNNRPLTTLTEDVDDLSPLTPSMFMKDLPVGGMPELDSIEAKDLREAYWKIRTLRKALECRFRKEYLAQLVQKKNEVGVMPLRIGDVVLIGADNRKRYEWPLGKIVELLPGRDGKIRVARVKTSRGELIRPLQRLYQLEMCRETFCEAPEPVTRSSQDVEETEELARVPVKTTRFGRVVKEPIRYAGWNY